MRKCNKDYNSFHLFIAFIHYWFIIIDFIKVMQEPLQLGICELYNSHLHGPCLPHVAGHYLMTYDIPLSDFYDNSCAEFISACPYANANDVQPPRLEIVQTATMEPDGECVAVIKTFWIRLLQRRWKRIFADRRRLLARLLKPYGLLKRECGIK